MDSAAQHCCRICQAILLETLEIYKAAGCMSTKVSTVVLYWSESGVNAKISCVLSIEASTVHTLRLLNDRLCSF